MSRKKRNKTVHYAHHSPGTAPGTLTIPDGALPPRITVIAYDEDNLVEATPENPLDIKPFLEKWPVTWVNVDGLGSVTVLEELGRIFDLHHLALEDVLNTGHRPKTEDFERYLFIVSRMAGFYDGHPDTEQISMFVGKNYVLTFQDKPGDCLGPVRERIRRGKGRRIKFSKPDYLGYAIVDAIIDGYFPVLESLGNRLEAIEDDIVANPSREAIASIHEIKRDLNGLRRAVWPMREVIGGFAGVTGDAVVRDDTRVYLRDCHDHAVQVLDILETFRERAGALMDIYLSSVSNRMNEVMKVLTIISTIFIPLTFIAGVYGMNFRHMPELDWPWSYPAVLALMAAIGGGLVLYFHRRGWIGKGLDSRRPGT